MVSTRLAIALFAGTVLMLVPVIIQSKWYKIKLWKSVVSTFLLTITGTIGTKILFYIENHRFDGVSFFGAVFFVPVIYVLFSFLLNERYEDIIDLCAPAECIMLVVMKTQCLMTGCCGGVLLCTLSNGKEIRFPSQLLEFINAVVLCIVLLWLAHKKSNRGYIYAWYLILYGSSRFVLNVFREEFYTTDMLLPYGNIWSLVAIAVGILWILILKRKHFAPQKR